MIALTLAGVGIYGVVAHAVRQRTREIGTRLALGARPVDIVWLVLRWGLTLAIAGVIIGGVAGLFATRSLESLLYGVTHTDPAMTATAVAVLLFTAFAASLVPARRAARMDPAKTLNH